MEKVCHSRFQGLHIEQRNQRQEHTSSHIPAQHFRATSPKDNSARLAEPNVLGISTPAATSTSIPAAIRIRPTINSTVPLGHQSNVKIGLIQREGYQVHAKPLSPISSLSVNPEAPASDPVVPDALGSPRHLGPSIQGSFHISRTASSFHGFEQNATKTYCAGQFPIDHLRFQQTSRPPQQPCPPICRF